MQSMYWPSICKTDISNVAKDVRKELVPNPFEKDSLKYVQTKVFIKSAEKYSVLQKMYKY